MNHHNFSVNLPIVFNYFYFVKKKSNHQVFIIQTIQKSKRSYFKIPCSNYPKYLNLKVSNFLIFLFSLKKGNFSLVVSPIHPPPPSVSTLQLSVNSPPPLSVRLFCGLLIFFYHFSICITKDPENSLKYKTGPSKHNVFRFHQNTSFPSKKLFWLRTGG